tara:strand:+ start:2301 stop:2825 length:525 start_codon:yes stop_codon:yes gene_type:complete
MWTELLEEVLPKPCFERPFVCRGFPSDSIAIVVGENPATPMQRDWWDYWRNDSGFDYEEFVSSYMQEREKIGRRISNTRRRLDRIRNNGVEVVETNAFRNERFDGVGVGYSNYKILSVLIANMPELRAVIAHGKHAAEWLSGANLSENIAVYNTRHFRSESYAVIDEICSDLVQ